MNGNQHLYGRIEAAADNVEAAAQALSRAQAARDDTVREALDAGATVNDLMAPAGLSRERLYQIRDRRR
jgi:hypothetical protein